MPMEADQATIDPIDLEVLWSRFRNIPLEMGRHFSRSARSQILKNARDLSTGIFTPSGDLIAQGVYAPGHLGSMPFMVKKLLDDHFPAADLYPGDIIATNDPYINSGHLPDIFLIKPIYLDDRLVGFGVVGGHHLDIGGAGVASYAMEGTDMWGEGLQLPPLKIAERGTVKDDILRIIKENSRLPSMIEVDLQAQFSALNEGCDKFESTLGASDHLAVDRYIDEIICRSERRIRSEIESLPDGTYDTEILMDGFDSQLQVCIEVSVDHDDILVDYAGTADQLERHAINAPETYTFAYTMLAIKSLLDPETPQTEGTIKPIEMRAPTGSIVSAAPPAPVSARQLMHIPVVRGITKALSEAVPEHCPAHGSQPTRQTFKFLNSTPDGSQLSMFDGVYGGAGARPDGDGEPAVSGISNLKNTPIEIIEAEYPLHFIRYNLIPDAAGAGEFQGGPGSVREYRLLERAEVQLVCENFDIPPEGLNGGTDSVTGSAVVNPGAPDERSFRSKDSFTVEEGDVLRITSPGGGGWGDPAERDESLVERDVRNGLISADFAETHYR